MQSFGQQSSIHGVKYVFSSENLKLSRTFWTLAFVLSFSGFSFYIYTAYVKWQVKPEIVMKAHERSASDFPGPAVTICSNLFARDNKANVFKTLKLFSERANINYDEEECFTLTANLHWCQPTFSRLARKACEKYDYESVDVLKYIDKSALTIDEAFYLCINGSCDDNIFRVFTDFGICYTTNMMTSSMIFTDEIHDDFKKLKTLYSNESEPLWTPEKGYKDEKTFYPDRAKRGFYDISMQPILNEIDKENICALKTFRIYFHKPNEIVTPFHDSIYLNYEEFMEFKIFPTSHITDEALRGFSPEIRKCYFEGEFKLKFFKTYTKALCEWECKANLSLEKCGCVKFSMPRDQKTKICNLYELLCIMQINELPCRCYAPCVDVKYSYKNDKTAFNRQFFVEKISNTSAVSWVQIVSETEIVEEIEHFMSYKVTNFISDCGGLLGLFMGCSLLSIIEIFYYLFNACLALKARRNLTADSSKIWAQKIDGISAIRNEMERKMRAQDDKISIILKTIEDIKNLLPNNNENSRQNGREFTFTIEEL